MQLHSSSCFMIPCLHSETCSEINMVWCVCWFFVLFCLGSSFFPPSPSAVRRVFLSFSICFLFPSYQFSLAFFLFACQILLLT